MKATRSIVPALVVFTVLIGVALSIGLVSRGGQQGQQTAALVDNGPNAGLSNEELVGRAAANMKALESYHLEFNGEGDSPQGGVTPRLAMTLDVSYAVSSTIGRITYVPGGGNDTDAFLGLNNYIHADDSLAIDVNISGDGWYESYDEGKIWNEVHSLGAAFAPLLLALIWGDGGPETTEGEQLLAGVALQDGSPKLELVDGVVTRHVSASIPELNLPNEERVQQLSVIRGGLGAKSVEIWASTGITPTIMRMHVEGSTDQRVDTSPLGSAEDATFSPDGKTLAVAYSPDEGGGNHPAVERGRLRSTPTETTGSARARRLQFGCLQP